MTSHTDTHNLTEHAAHLTRLGAAVETHASRGEVEVLIADLRATAHALAHPDLAHALDKGGDDISDWDEPLGDAMHWKPQ